MLQNPYNITAKPKIATEKFLRIDMIADPRGGARSMDGQSGINQFKLR